VTVIDWGSRDELDVSCSLWEEKMSDDDDGESDEDCEFMKDLNNDVKSGNSLCLLSLVGLSATVVEDDEGAAGVVTLAASLIWRFT